MGIVQWNCWFKVFDSLNLGIKFGFQDVSFSRCLENLRSGKRLTVGMIQRVLLCLNQENGLCMCRYHCDIIAADMNTTRGV